MPTLPTLADRAIELGFTTTDWFDTSQGHPGIERHGTLNPRAADWLSRYGTNGSMIEYNPRNWAGAHAPAGNTDAPIVYVEVFRQLGKPIDKTANDLSDFDLIDGLTRFVTDQAARLRITADSALGQGNTGQPDFPPPAPPVIPVDPNPQPGTQPGQPGQPGQPPVAADPCAFVRSELALAEHALGASNAELDATNAAIKSINKILNGLTIPTRGGGAAWNALRQIDKILS